ncbi:MAG: 3-deoxy-D-manno-octulosonic acid transferase, partial [Asticcacaulis sp.]
ELIEAGAAWRVSDSGELAFLIGELRKSPAAVTVADRNALALSQREAGTLDRVWHALEPLLPQPVETPR